MKMGKYQKAKINTIKSKAIKLYRQGYTLREVGKIVNKSHEWVRKAVKERGG